MEVVYVFSHLISRVQAKCRTLTLQRLGKELVVASLALFKHSCFYIHVHCEVKLIRLLKEYPHKLTCPGLLLAAVIGWERGRLVNTDSGAAATQVQGLGERVWEGGDGNSTRRGHKTFCHLSSGTTWSGCFTWAPHKASSGFRLLQVQKKWSVMEFKYFNISKSHTPYLPNFTCTQTFPSGQPLWLAQSGT